MLREAGYYTTYKGKWHLTKEFETVNELGSPTRIFEKHFKELLKVLPARKAARYMQIENKIDAVMRYETAKVIPLVQ